MSYRKQNTGNAMNDYLSSLTNFVVLAPHLIEAKNTNSFQIWLEKLEKIDRRALLLYLRKNKNNIPAEHIKIAQRRFVEEI
jgi:hypothetical protein